MPEDSKEPREWRVVYPEHGFEPKRMLAADLLARLAIEFPEDATPIRGWLDRVAEQGTPPVAEACRKALAKIDRS